MNDTEALLIETQAKQLLLEAGIVDKLKAMDLYIWAVNAHDDRMIFSLDTTRNPKADTTAVGKLLSYVLQAIKLPIHVQVISIQDHCCYGNCKGCLNGNPHEQAVWIGQAF